MLQTLKAVIFCYKTSLGLQKHYRLNVVKEAIIYELKYNLGSEYNEDNIPGGLFKARFPKDKVRACLLQSRCIYIACRLTWLGCCYIHVATIAVLCKRSASTACRHDDGAVATG